MSMNWAMWREVGIAATTALPPDLRALREQHLLDAITPEEGAEVLHRALAWNSAAQLVISPIKLQSLLATEDFSPEALLSAAQRQVEQVLKHPRPELRTSFVAPRSEIEQIVAELWENVLGVTPIGVNDDFFELGGHSLLAILIISRLRETMRIEVPTRQLFELSSVAKLSEAVEEILVAEIEALSEEEVQYML